MRAPPSARQTGRVRARTGPAADHPGGADTDHVIQARGLTKNYPGDVTAVDGLDLSVRTGEIFGLLGPNGAGKTTTVGMLTTRVVPTAGRAVIAGIDVVADPARTRQVIGVVSQATTLDRDLTVRENLSFHARYFGMKARDARAAADRWLEAFRLAGKATAPVDALSGGMARRLMLARAMLHDPAVVFLDEPTAGLDPQSRLALWEIITGLHTAGQTVFLTTHYIEEADQFCQRVAIMDHGRILALDTPQALKGSLRTGASVTVRTDDDPDRLAAHLATIDGARGTWRLDRSVRVHLDRADGAFVKVRDAAARGGFDLTDVSVAQPSLESVFLSLTGEELRE